MKTGPSVYNNNNNNNNNNHNNLYMPVLIGLLVQISSSISYKQNYVYKK